MTVTIFQSGGAGTQWIPELEDEDSDYHDLYQTVRDDTAICDYCSGVFGVEDAVADAELVTLDDHDGHPSIRSLVDNDRLGAGSRDGQYGGRFITRAIVRSSET